MQQTILGTDLLDSTNQSSGTLKLKVAAVTDGCIKRHTRRNQERKSGCA
jgi:hypothetical protein